MIASKSSKILALDLGTKTGWASGKYIKLHIFEASGTIDFSNKRFEGGGMRYLRFQSWLDTMRHGEVDEIYFEEVRNHVGTSASHVYGGFMATLTSWCEKNCIPYQGVPVKTIKKYITGNGNANKQMVIDAVRSRGYEVNDDNEADAMALLLYVKERRSHE